MRLGEAITKLKLLLMISLLASTNVSHATITADLKPVGEATLKWMFMDIYNASLYSRTGNYQELHYPQALTIHYHKNIDRQRLIDATREQWQQQQLNAALYKPWLSQLTLIFPDVKEGDRLTFYVSEQGEGFFYYNQVPVGGIQHPDFAAAFLGIWLARNTALPSLRKQLIGEQ